MRSPRKTPYLWERPNTDSFWFSRAVPKHLKIVEGRSVIQFSLGTTDREEAKALVRHHAAKFDIKWGLAAPTVRESDALDPSIHAITVGYDRMMAALEADRRTWPDDDGSYVDQLNKRQNDARKINRRIADGILSQWEAMADRVIADKGFTIQRGSQEYADFVRSLAHASLDALDTFNRKHGGELNAAPRTSVVQEAKAKAADKAAPGEGIMDLFERWAADALAKNEKREDTINQDRKAIAQFVTFIGEGRSIRSITPLEVAEYRDTLRDLPPKWMSNKQLKNLPIREAAAKAREMGLPCTAFTSVNKALSTISPLFKFLAAQPKWAGLRNPCDGLFHQKVKGKNRRPSFSTEHLNTILKSPLFTGFLREGKEHLPGNQHADDWRKWIPLVCLFSGARIGEIAQLRIGDVRQDHRMWFIRIRENEAEGLQTKSRQDRPALLHAILEAMGFLSFHGRQLERAGGDLRAPLFPELQPNARGQISGEPSRWWRDYLSNIGVKNGADGFGAHSFRHTLADRLRVEAELFDHNIALILGHSVPSTTGGYGAVAQGTANMLKGWIDAVRFEGVDFSHLIGDRSVNIGD
ncbi:hypothetical protein EBF16_11630 [Sphingobium yanoikuyae]|uniref:Tyr recombinase domain-containing protein n=1 Tax=Sphingobium yanoikuyae TaxID=13690 RepID=A0A3G2UQR9_SPHYA|nr:hypothetical protein EBF16_11630 [Sphingobium yanoikuyae]